MRATVVEDWCDPKDMRLKELPDPQPGRGEVTIDMRAVGCNFFDILIAQGKYQVRPPRPFSPAREPQATQASPDWRGMRSCFSPTASRPIHPATYSSSTAAIIAC